MTKKELIELLKDYPDDIEIYVDNIQSDLDLNDEHWTSGVREPFIHIKMVKDNKIAKKPSKITKDAKKSLIF
jgi:hypothetical protein